MQGPREVQKRELVFLQFRLNQSSEDFSAIDYLLFSSFQEFLQRCPQTPLDPKDLTLAMCIPGLGAGAGAGNQGRQEAAGLTEGP